MRKMYYGTVLKNEEGYYYLDKQVKVNLSIEHPDWIIYINDIIPIKVPNGMDTEYLSIEEVSDIFLDELTADLYKMMKNENIQSDIECDEDDMWINYYDWGVSLMYNITDNEVYLIDIDTGDELAYFSDTIDNIVKNYIMKKCKENTEDESK